MPNERDEMVAMLRRIQTQAAAVVEAWENSSFAAWHDGDLAHEMPGLARDVAEVDAFLSAVRS